MENIEKIVKEAAKATEVENGKVTKEQLEIIKEAITKNTPKEEVVEKLYSLKEEKYEK